jgi:DDE superfamily endonuclease
MKERIMTVLIQSPVIIATSIMPIPLTKTEFKSFRKQLYNEFEHCSDSAMDLLDALCSNIQSPSVVQLSLNPLFRRGYSALFKTLGGNLFAKASQKDNSPPQAKQLQSLDLISQVVPLAKQRHFFLFGLDCTSISRPFAETLKDRGIVHQPTPIKGNKPITIGHSYSMLAVLPERNDGDSPWTIPLDMSRVPTESNGTQVGIAQLNTVLSHPNLPWSDSLCVSVVDSAYGNKKFLAPLHEHSNLVTVVRARSNRVFYQSPVDCQAPPTKGHPLWYGARFALADEQTWHEPNEISHTNYQTRRGRTINVTITVWRDMLMRGGKGLATHQCPFTLLRVVSVDEAGRNLFRPMWLIVMGARREEISSVQGYQSYRQRFDLEHTFRFKKQNLLLNGFETPVLDHEEQWIALVNLAYVQLWAAHLLVVALPRPWETNLKQSDPSARISPSKVQQAWNSIISQLGTPAVAPKPRGISQGRPLGQSQTPRPRLPVIKKGKSQNTLPAIAA